MPSFGQCNRQYINFLGGSDFEGIKELWWELRFVMEKKKTGESIGEYVVSSLS